MTNELQSRMAVAPALPEHHDYLGDAGNIASILGLAISIWVLISLRRIRNQFLFKARYPALKKALSAHSAALSKQLSAFPGSLAEVEEELQRCLANLKNLKGKLTGPTRKSARAAISRISGIRKTLSQDSKRDVREAYMAVISLETDLQNLSEDQKWRSD